MTLFKRIRLRVCLYLDLSIDHTIVRDLLAIKHKGKMTTETKKLVTEVLNGNLDATVGDAIAKVEIADLVEYAEYNKRVIAICGYEEFRAMLHIAFTTSDSGLSPTGLVSTFIERNKLETHDQLKEFVELIKVVHENYSDDYSSPLSEVFRATLHRLKRDSLCYALDKAMGNPNARDYSWIEDLVVVLLESDMAYLIGNEPVDTDDFGIFEPEIHIESMLKIQECVYSAHVDNYRELIEDPELVIEVFNDGSDLNKLLLVRYIRENKGAFKTNFSPKPGATEIRLDGLLATEGYLECVIYNIHDLLWAFVSVSFDNYAAQYTQLGLSKQLDPDSVPPDLKSLIWLCRPKMYNHLLNKTDFSLKDISIEMGALRVTGEEHD